jgi:hypothetical protein
MTQQEYEDLIEELEYELEQANDLKSKAVEDNHDELVKTANTQIAIAEAKLWQIRNKRNLTLPMEHFICD